MKYVKYLFGVFVLLGIVLFGVSSVKAEEVPAGVNSIERQVLFWEYETQLQNQLLVRSNRFYINNTYKYFLFDLKYLAGYTIGGSLGVSNAIHFYSSNTATASSDVIYYDELDFDNFIDMSNYTDRWIEFRWVLDVTDYYGTMENLLNSINNNPNYQLSVLALSGSGIISQNDLYDYLTDYIDSFVSNRIDNAYQNGFNDAKNQFGYNNNGSIISGETAYDMGYNKGTQDSGDLKADIINFVPGVLGSIFMFFFQLGQIGILGITILDIIGILVLISGLIFLIKFFF